MKDSTRVLVALGAGLAGGAANAASRQYSACSRPVDAVALVGTLLVNAIRMTVIPLVMSMLIVGIAVGGRSARRAPGGARG